MTQSKWTKLYNGIQFLYFCGTVNFLFLVGVLAGGIIFGFGPSLIAAHQVVKTYHKKESDKVIKEFISAYRENFKLGNQLFLLWFLIAAIIIIDNRIVQQLDINSPVISIVMNGLKLILISWGIVLAPMVTYYQLSVKKYFVNALYFVPYHLVGTCLALLWFGICFYGSFLLPGLIPVFSFGIWIVGNMGFYLRFFDENENRLKSMRGENSK